MTTSKDTLNVFSETDFSLGSHESRTLADLGSLNRAALSGRQVGRDIDDLVIVSLDGEMIRIEGYFAATSEVQRLAATELGMSVEELMA